VRSRVDLRQPNPCRVRSEGVGLGTECRADQVTPAWYVQRRPPPRAPEPPGGENLPILLPMEELPLAEARNRLSELIADVEKTHSRVTITKHGHPAAVLVSPEDLAALEETLDILSDPEALAAIREAEAEYARGEVTTGEDMARFVERRRRRETGAA
jgi:antitoxin YefM